MINPEQYRESLDDLHLDLYIRGTRRDRPSDNPAVSCSRDAIARTYEMAHIPEHEQVMVAISHVTGSRVNRFNHISQTIDDLIKKAQLNSLFNGNNGRCFQRTRGMNTLHALSITTGEIDAANGTHHHARFLEYLRYIQEHDLTCDGSLVDPGWHRSLPPHRHPNADLFLHAVDETANGVILRGVKACGLSALNSHEIIVLPTTAMTERDETYAVFFAVPTDTERLAFMIDPASQERAKPVDSLMARAAGTFRNHEVLCVFDDVVVPWERIFLYRECAFSEQIGDLLRFSFCFDT